MVIFELPSNSDNGGLRACCLGSCRVQNPLYRLRDRGDLRICDDGLAATHTAGEALQALDLVTGQRIIPEEFSLYVFETEKTPPTQRLARTLKAGIDVFLLEVSDDKQFVCGDILLQQNFLVRNLVQAHRGALLPWYRNVCRRVPIDEHCVEDALKRMREEGFRPNEAMADLLRGVRLERQSGEQIAHILGQLMSTVGGDLVVVGSITAPGEGGVIMQHRRALNEKLSQACGALGALFYDPSKLIIDYGRVEVLESQGANVNEYARDFWPTVGETLVNLVRRRGSARGRASRREKGRVRSAGSRDAHDFRARLADKVNAELLELHRLRRAELDSSASGLYAYYERRLDRGAVVDARDRAAFDLIEGYLPSYDVYAVMRAGVGELALLLAASGRRVIAYEPNGNRRAAIEAGARRLEATGLLAPEIFTTVPALVPEGPLEGRVLGIGLDVSHVLDEAAAAPVVEKARFFAGLLIDLRLFVRVRETVDDQTILAEALRNMGFDQHRDYPAEHLFWFHRSAPKRARPTPISAPPL